MISRGPLTLAALASAAVPGLDPDTVEGVRPSSPADTVEAAFIQDREHRRWVIRCPRTPAASAQLERSAALLTVLARRLGMPVPTVRGWAALPEGGRAAVHSYLTGRLVTLEGIEAGSTLAIGLGRALAHLHNLDITLFEEAGVPVYDAASYRTRRLAELDRAAATGRVPTGLLNRWERVLDDASLWSFTATPTHGAIGSDTVLATPDDGTDLDVKAFLSWEYAQVADPADDMAPLYAALEPEAFETVREAYAHTRVDRPDRNLYQRAEVIGEMQLVRTMMAAVAAGDDEGAEEHATQLRRLDDRLAKAEEEAARTHAVAATSEPTAEVPSAEVASEARGTTPEPVAARTKRQKVKPAKAEPETTGPTKAEAEKTTPTTTAEPEKTTPEEATAAGADDFETQPVPVRAPQRGSATHPDRSQAKAAGAESDDDAVQVEHPGVPTPVVTPASKAGATSTPAVTAPVPPPAPAPISPDTAAGDSAGTASTSTGSTSTGSTSTESASPGATGAEATPQQPARPQWSPPQVTPLRDAFPHDVDDQTAEIVPINDEDDDDDVRPLDPRK